MRILLPLGSTAQYGADIADSERANVAIKSKETRIRDDLFFRAKEDMGFCYFCVQAPFVNAAARWHDSRLE